MDKNYSVMQIGTFGKDLAAKGRIMAGEQLGLTGCEVSFNYSPAGTFTPFVHSHKQNEETYIVISGTGMFMAGGEEFPITEGSVIRVAPAADRAIKAGETDLSFICIQAKAGSLTQASGDDGVITETKASWMAE